MGRSTQSETQEYTKHLGEKVLTQYQHQVIGGPESTDHSNLSEQEPVNITVWQTDEDTV